VGRCAKFTEVGLRADLERCELATFLREEKPALERIFRAVTRLDPGVARDPEDGRFVILDPRIRDERRALDWSRGILRNADLRSIVGDPRVARVLREAAEKGGSRRSLGLWTSSK
jgi:hypothetical protein